MTTTEKVQALRLWMKAQVDGANAIHTGKPVTAYFVPTADPHNDEYIPDHWKCREWLTGFTGSAGTALVTADEALLWTDSRYWLQAEEQLKGSPVRLMRDGQEGVPSPVEWISQNDDVRKGMVACPADMLSNEQADGLRRCGVELYVGKDAFDDIWNGRPALPHGSVDVFPEKFAGESASEKLSRVRSVVKKYVDDGSFSIFNAQNARFHEAQSRFRNAGYLVNDLSEIAWLLNLRGVDVEFNPVFLSYLWVGIAEDKAFLFANMECFTSAAREALAAANVEVRPYGETPKFVSDHDTLLDNSASVLFDGSNLAGQTILDYIPPVIPELRMVKNATELCGMREAMLRDGVALVKFHRWLDESMEKGEKLTEISVDEKLTSLRAQQPGFKERSFATIAGYGPHGAVVHYEPTPETDVQLEPRSLLLLDSGAQYDCGTTDITRTVALGPLTEEEKRVYTLVLKGHLALAHQQFPDGATGLQLDLAARQHMWNEGYDFGHGTGHGVGTHLCVHEGPQQIRKDVRPCTAVRFRPGMTVTDEPGLYVAGRFGARIENVLVCVESRTTDFGRFDKFETLTLCPYDLRPVDRSMLTPVEVEQINAYHATVRERILPLLDDEADRNWLRKATERI